jgi:AcrR family transcriptional regulator
VAVTRELSKVDVQSVRAEIGAAAAQLYAQAGEAGITIREIAKATGRSPMGLYRYFGDREEIIAFLRAEAFDKFSDALEAAFASGSDAFARARAVGRAYLDFALENPDAYRLMFDLRRPDASKYPALAAAARRAGETVTRHVKDLAKAGIVQPGDTVKIGASLWAAAHGVIVLYLAGRLPERVDVREFYLETMRLTFRGARTPATKRKARS